MKVSTQPVFTVVTVTYNAFHTLHRTLQSVAEQDLSAVEHLIIDGCSTDHTLSLVHQYVADNTVSSLPHLIRVVSEPDEGLYDAMNKALALASGEYIVFLNAGDTFASPQTLSQLIGDTGISYADPYNPAVLYGHTDLVDDGGHFLRHRRLQPADHLSWRDFQMGMLVCHQSFYVRSDIARQIKYDKRYRFSADFDWCIRIMKYAQRRRMKIVGTQKVLTHYLSEGMTTRNHRASLLERFSIMATHYGVFTAVCCHLWFVVRSVYK